MPTPHNNAKKGDIAETVLMPGDPRRAEFIAKRYLQDPVLFNEVRGMLGYTGTYNGKRISVMGSGMGMPSIGIYSYELFTQYDVENIIRVGSCGAYAAELNLFDVLLVEDAYSESSYAKVQSGYEGDVIAGSAALGEILTASASKLDIPLVKGRIHSSDVFYRQPQAEGETPYWQKLCSEKGCLGVEMESFALFHNAGMTGKKAACLLTVSDSFVTSKETTAEERERSFTRMMEIALGVL